MNDATTGILSFKSRSSSLAVASIVVWLAAAASAGPLGIWSAIGGTAVALGLAVLLFGRPASTALLKPSPRLILLGAVAGGLMAVTTYVLYPLLAQIVPFIVIDTAELYAAFRAPSLVVASLALVPVILGEELVWRGVVQASLVQRLGVAILDERKGHRLCRQLFPDLQVGWTVDLFSNSKVQAHLGNEQLAVALYQALRDARMSVPQSHLPWLIGLIGADRASECSSLPKWQAAI